MKFVASAKRHGHQHHNGYLFRASAVFTHLNIKGPNPVLRYDRGTTREEILTVPPACAALPWQVFRSRVIPKPPKQNSLRNFVFMWYDSHEVMLKVSMSPVIVDSRGVMLGIDIQKGTGTFV